MNILLSILGIIVGIASLIVAGFIVASKRFEAKIRKENADLESKYTLPKEKRRLLAYGAQLALYRVESPRILPVKVPLDALRNGLAAAWDVSSREEALDTIQWLLEEGHRTPYDEVYQRLRAGDFLDEEQFGVAQKCYEDAKEVISSKLRLTDEDFDRIQSIAAWDYERAVNIARWSYALDYITEEELWGFMEKAAVKANETYSSWEEYFVAFAFGRGIAYQGDIYDIVWNGKQLLLEDQESIWKEFDFKLAS